MDFKFHSEIDLLGENDTANLMDIQILRQKIYSQIDAQIDGWIDRLRWMKDIYDYIDRQIKHRQR